MIGHIKGVNKEIVLYSIWNVPFVSNIKMTFIIVTLVKKVYARIVKKCGKKIAPIVEPDTSLHPLCPIQT